MDYKKCFNLFLGGKKGTFKGVNVNKLKTIVKNIHSLSLISKDNEISAMAWGDPDERDILIGFANQTVKIYDTDFKAFTNCVDVKCGQGPLRGVSRYDESLVTGVESGHVKVWRFDSSDEDLLVTDSQISKMCHSRINPDVIATGGKENDLKLWNLKSKECIFKAKNVRRDTLELEVPVWVSDIGFLPESSNVVVCSRYGHVRLYDPKSSQRRPVVSIHIKDEVLTSLAVASREEHVVVGSGRGAVTLIDLRKPGSTVHNFRGPVGSIRSIACHRTKPYVASVGLDRFLRVHDLNTREFVCQEYVKSQLNCVLMRDTFDTIPLIEQPSNDDVEIIEDDDDDYDALFDNLERVGKET